MIFRRRCGGSDCLALLFITSVTLFFILVCSILYGTRTENPSLPLLVKEVLPAGRCLCESSTTFQCGTCLDCASHPAILANITSEEDEAWVFDRRRHGNDYGLDEDQCHAAFPGLFEDIQLAKKFRKKKGKITEQELSSFKLTKGMVRVLIFNGQLHIVQTFLVDNVNRQKALAALSALHRALVSSKDRSSIPNIEFILSVEDLPAQPKKPIWVLARRAQDQDLWLMPDFGWWSWDMPQIGALDEVATEASQRESVEPWDQKLEKLVWRGKVTMAPKLRRALLDATKGKPWSDVGQLKWQASNFKQQFKGPVDQCQYKFIAHVEGRSYSGALKYRQLCRSVIVSHKLQWIQHYHYLLISSGPQQNFVEVERDFSDLSYAMDDLLQHPEKAKRIADNSIMTFRDRYLTAAAEACYWRALVKAYRDVTFEPLLYSGVEVGEAFKRTKKRGVRFETFVLYESDETN
ncbi:hypothetical protein DM02DRAFT_667457 [Periconia macrospinosa]|uniref:Glycosyl transferase CAP10 domain-containing protein n=1 Tax=Periconia macrospinosa TaxID=97972 RepID=A0A2V1E7I6_9PLEO|nr:hypothetical protein DM02DRAFT_667457 [Periconia macrospinosa]